MNRNLFAFPLFIVAATVMTIFNVIVLELGDAKFPSNLETAISIYLPIWLLGYAPHMISGWLILSKNINAPKSQKVATTTFTLITLLLLEVSFIFDADYIILGVELIITLLIAFGLRFWLKSKETHEKA